MLNFDLLVTDSDRKEAATRERRQRQEAERRQRIFDNKYRKIGVDADALEWQVKNNRFINEKEKEWERNIEKQMHDNSTLAVLLERKEQEEKCAIQRDMDLYRKVYQRKEDRREADMNCPDYLRKQIPPRSRDGEDVSLPSGQKFEGEDLHKVEREKVMRQQSSAWLRQQMEERSNRELREKLADNQYHAATISQDMRALHLELLDKNCRRMINSANERYNKALADERAKIKVINLENEIQDNQADIYNSLTSDLLTENRYASNSMHGPHRVIPYMYKGMSQDEIRAIKSAQSSQIVEKSNMQATEKKMESDWHSFEKGLLTMASSSDIELEQKRRLVAVETQRENLELAWKQKEQQKYIENVVFTNEVTDDFFKHFNSSSR